MPPSRWEPRLSHAMPSPTSPFAILRTDLRGRGFSPKATGGRRGIYMVRRSGPLGQAVGAMIGGNRGGACNIQLHLTMPLRGADPPHEVIILNGDVAASGIRIEEAWRHDPAFPTWWPPSQMDAARHAVLNLGLPWLERFSDLRVLTEYFEAEFRKWEAEQLERPSFLTSLLRWVGLRGRPARTGHHEYLLWLAMLYEERGLLDLARDRLEAYATETATAHRMSVHEEARLGRHRQALGPRPH